MSSEGSGLMSSTLVCGLILISGVIFTSLEIGLETDFTEPY